jgi:ankyrin repeat protein
MGKLKVQMLVWLFPSLALSAAPRLNKRDQRLMDAVTGGSPLWRVNEALKKGADVNTKDAKGTTALMHSASQGDRNIPLITFLLENGADVEHENERGKTAFDMAWLQNRGSAGAVEVLQFQHRLNEILEKFKASPRSKEDREKASEKIAKANKKAIEKVKSEDVTDYPSRTISAMEKLAERATRRLRMLRGGQ